MATQYPQAPTLYDFAMKKAALDEIARQRTLDMEVARRNMMIGQLQQANTVQALGELMRGNRFQPGVAGTTGLLQKALESGASPKMSDEYKRAVQGEQQGLQDFLTAPENQPDYQPKRSGLGNFLHNVFTPQVPRDYSAAQKGLLSTALSGEPVPTTEIPAEGGAGAMLPTGMQDFSSQEQRLERRKGQTDIEANRARGQYYERGGAGTGLWVFDENGNPIEPYQQGQVLSLGQSVGTPGTQRAQAQDDDVLASKLFGNYSQLKQQLDSGNLETDEEDWIKRQMGMVRRQIDAVNNRRFAEPQRSGGAQKAGERRIETANPQTGEVYLNGQPTGAISKDFLAQEQAAPEKPEPVAAAQPWGEMPFPDSRQAVAATGPAPTPSGRGGPRPEVEQTRAQQAAGYDSWAAQAQRAGATDADLMKLRSIFDSGDPAAIQRAIDKITQLRSR